MTTGRQMTVGLVGFGTVGRSVARILAERRGHDLRLVGVCTRRPEARRREAQWLGTGVHWTDDIDTLLRTGAQVIVEVIGGMEPARTWIETALRAGRSVVTANKQVVAEHGRDLTRTARDAGCSLLFEAAVGGVVPVIRGIQQGLGSDRLTRIVGVVNGTCNFVLGQMADARVSLDDAVIEAQARGYAEADPSADLDGLDARAKLSILATLGLDDHVRPSDVTAESIRALDRDDLSCAAGAGLVARQIAWAERADDDRIGAGVLPALVGAHSWFARASGPENVVVVTGDRSGQTVFAGQGAGGAATAIAVVSDVLAVAAGSPAAVEWPRASGEPVHDDMVASHYVRVRQPQGSVAAIQPAEVLRRAGFLTERVLTSRSTAGSSRWAAIVAPCSHQRLNRVLAELVPASGAGGGAIGLPLFDAVS